MTAPDGAPQLRYQAHDIAWDLDTVLKAATKFSQAANAAVHLYRRVTQLQFRVLATKAKA
jgi:hypothetical protein